VVKVFRPAALAEALKIRSETGALPFAGGTDLMVRFRAKNGLPPSIDGPMLFLDGLKELQNIVLSGDALEIGAGVPMAVAAGDPGWGATPGAEAIPAVLRRAAAELGAPALRRRATIAGNVANASPAGDTLAALYALGASVVLTSAGGERILDIGDFVTAPGRTVLAADEIIRALRIPRPLPDWSWWRKVGTRRANALTKVSVSAAALIRGGRVASFALAFGAVGPTVVRVREAEALLTGAAADDLSGESGGRLAGRLAELARDNIRPIDDQRSTARYRKTVALNLIGEAVSELARKLKENAA
jgi:CO/xanthine dehydrogenase FAD-binding subunit